MQQVLTFELKKKYTKKGHTYRVKPSGEDTVGVTEPDYSRVLDALMTVGDIGDLRAARVDHSQLLVLARGDQYATVSLPTHCLHHVRMLTVTCTQATTLDCS